MTGCDPLAPVVSPWSVAPPAAGTADPAVPHPTALRELADRAGLQINILRHTLDEAIRVDRAIGGKANELAQRLEQAGRFEREMDRRLDAAGRSVGILDHAANAVAALEKVITEMRTTHVSVEEGFRRELAAQQERTEQQLAEREARFSEQLAEQERRITRLIDQYAEAAGLKLQEHSEAFAARLAEISDQGVRALHTAQAHVAAAESEAMRLRDNMERGLKAEVDQLASSLERQSAQVQARVCIVLDEASQRVAELERTAARVGVTANERLEKVCDRAAAVLGHDPRKIGMGVEPHNNPASNSLADLTERAETAAKLAEEHLLRLSVASDRAGEIEMKLKVAIEEVGSIKTGQQMIDEAAAAEQRLGSLRDDLESMATSVRYNLSQAQHAEAILGKTIDRARDKVHSLDHAMNEVTQQAGSMVQVARDVASLVMRAEQAREALTTTIEAAADKPAESATPIRPGARRAPFGPPKQVRGDDNAAAA
jgi:hypothetical protein